MLDDASALRKGASTDRALVLTSDATSNTDFLGEEGATARAASQFALSGKKPGPVGQSSDQGSHILAAAIDDLLKRGLDGPGRSAARMERSSSRALPLNGARHVSTSNASRTPAMTAQITPVSGANFETEVARSDVPVLIDFWAPWCGPCMALMPTLQALAPMYDGSLKVVKVNIDECPELADKFSVQGIPHLLLTRRGEPVATLHDRSRTRLASELDSLLDQDGGA